MEHFMVTMPTLPNHAHFKLSASLASSSHRNIEQIASLHARCELHKEDYTAAKLDWHTSTECQVLHTCS